jgi:hypothetical protein
VSKGWKKMVTGERHAGPVNNDGQHDAAESHLADFGIPHLWLAFMLADQECGDQAGHAEGCLSRLPAPVPA